MRLERLHIAAFVGVAALIWWGVLYWQGTAVSWVHAQPFSAVVGGLVLLGALLEKVLWRKPPLNRGFIKRPDIRGTWRVEIRSTFAALGSVESTEAVVGYVAVEQTWSTLQMHLMTPDSESWLISSAVRLSPNGAGYQVIGVYTNEPEVHLRAERISEMHQGAFILETHGNNSRPVTMTAKYWTDRGTAGSMDFTRRIDGTVTRFDDASQLFC